MKKLLLPFLFFVFFSCSDSDTEQLGTGQSGQSVVYGQDDIVTDASGVEYPFLDPSVLSYCGPGWGEKFCRFLAKYDGTIWTDADNYYSDFSDIKFENFSGNIYFISFFNLDSTASYCDGWKLGETIYNGVKWKIKIKRDEVDILWFDYEYYGASKDIEYTVTYKYEVIDGLLHFSRTDGQTFVFHPSERNYSVDSLDTSEIIVSEGCMFY